MLWFSVFYACIGGVKTPTLHALKSWGIVDCVPRDPPRTAYIFVMVNVFGPPPSLKWRQCVIFVNRDIRRLWNCSWWRDLWRRFRGRTGYRMPCTRVWVSSMWMTAISSAIGWRIWWGNWILVTQSECISYYLNCILVVLLTGQCSFQGWISDLCKLVDLRSRP